jgi:hypothetical protein
MSAYILLFRRRARDAWRSLPPAPECWVPFELDGSIPFAEFVRALQAAGLTLCNQPGVSQLRVRRAHLKEGT